VGHIYYVYFLGHFQCVAPIFEFKKMFCVGWGGVIGGWDWVGAFDM
jgi:hypothetical protein